jgi:hypothetical protein
MKNLFRLFGAGMLFATASSALADVHYVDVNGTNATPPYASWSTAATNIQDAVDAAVAGDEIVVTNGTYSSVGVYKPLSVRSVKGSQFTIIDARGWGSCAYLTNSASLSGFTLQNGYLTDWDNTGLAFFGGGAYGGTLNNCVVVSNMVEIPYDDNGAQAYGGGAAYCTLNNCTIHGNSVVGQPYGHTGFSAAGGGAFACTLSNCTLTGNSSVAFPVGLAEGGGADQCQMYNCTLAGNSAGSATSVGYIYGGEYDANNNNNCVFFGNIRWDYGGYGFPNRKVCEDCVSPGVPFPGNNWHGDPLFVDTNTLSNLRLQPNSPCINAGNNSYVTNATDLDGNPRISGGTVDIGAYEYQWPQLTLTPSDTNIVLSWPTNNLGYDYTGFTVQSTTNLISPLVWDTSSPAPVVIGSQNVVTNPITGDQMFYRLSQAP